MVQIAGKYLHESNENFEEYLKTFGSQITPEMIKQYASSKPTIDVELNGDNCSISSSQGQAHKFKFGQSYKDDLFPGQDIESTGTLNGNKIEIRSVNKTSGQIGARVYEFTDSGLTIHYKESNAEAKRYYKRN